MEKNRALEKKSPKKGGPESPSFEKLLGEKRGNLKISRVPSGGKQTSKKCGPLERPRAENL